MNTPSFALVVIQLLLLLLVVGCHRDPADNLQGQRNLKLTFFGLAVDQEGRPLENVKFVFRVEAYPADWTFATRGQDNDVSQIVVTTDLQGRFAVEIDACFLRITGTGFSGYRHLNDEEISEGGLRHHSIRLISWGQQLYKSDPDRPAVFVFVKDGVKEVSALPSRGGYEAEGSQWIPNEPRWPRKPSLKDVCTSRRRRSRAPGRRADRLQLRLPLGQRADGRQPRAADGAGPGVP